LSALIRSDLAFTLKYCREPAFDMWEEDRGLHYHTLCVSAAALNLGAAWLQDGGERELAQSYRAAAQALHGTLDDWWLPDHGHYRWRVWSSGARWGKGLDLSVILAAIHAIDGPSEGHDAHTAHDPRVHATLARLEELFDTAYPINHDRPPDTAPAMGRYAG